MDSVLSRFRLDFDFLVGIAVLTLCGFVVECRGGEANSKSADRGSSQPQPSELAAPEAGTAKAKVDRSGNRIPAVLDKFVQVRAGMKLAEVHKQLGADGEFGFSYLDEQKRIWLFEEYKVVLALSDRSHAEYMPTCYLLYQDGALFGLISPDAASEFSDLWRERSPRQPRERGEKDVDFDDEAYIMQWHFMKQARGDDIPKAMERLRQNVMENEDSWKRERDSNDGDPFLGALLIGVSLFTKPTDDERVAEINKIFDPYKVRIGMTEDEVNELFDKPLYRKALDASRTVGLYGAKDPEMPWSALTPAGATPIMVLFEDGRAGRVLANRFIYHCWKSRIWPEYFGTCKEMK